MNLSEAIVFLIYLVFMLGIGIYFFFKNRNGGDKTYFLGGRQMGPWVTALSAGASDMSAWVLMGLPTSIYALGLGQLWISVGLAIGYTISWLCEAPRLRRFSIVADDSITIPQYLTNRFLSKSKALQIICAVIFLVAYTIYAASSVKACGTLFNTVTGVNETVAMYVASIIIIGYTFLGGFSAVCWTDFFQGMLMLAALLVAPIFALFMLKGVGVHPVDTPNFFNPFSSWKDIVSGLGWGLGYFGMPHILVRFMSIKKPSMIRKSSTVAIVWVIISLLAAVLIAYFGRMVMGEELLTAGNQKLVFIAMSRRFFPAGICGLLLAAIIAASISTADSQLLVASSSFTADLYKPFFRKNATEKETLMVGRVLVLVLSAIAFFIANSKGSGAQAIMDMVENAWGAFGASFGPTILLSLFWRRFNYKGAVAGVVSGFVVDLGWLLTGLTASTGVFEIVPGFIASLIVAVVVTKLTPAPNAEAVEIFDKATSKDAD